MMDSNTGRTLLGDFEMTPSTSDVAVWYSSASVTSFVRAWTSSNSRTLLMAMTA